MEKIFCVNVMFFSRPNELKEDRKPGWHLTDDLKRERCWGWFTTLEEAKQCIMENWADIYECGYYNAALIEEISPGIVSRPKEYWYIVEFDGENDTYNIEEMDRPACLKNIICFSFHRK